MTSMRPVATLTVTTSLIVLLILEVCDVLSQQFTTTTRNCYNSDAFKLVKHSYFVTFYTECHRMLICQLRFFVISATLLTRYTHAVCIYIYTMNVLFTDARQYPVITLSEYECWSCDFVLYLNKIQYVGI